MRNYALPSQNECRAMIRDCHVPVHIVKHAEAVAKLGVFLAERLTDGGIDVDIPLVERACLLHDLFRVCDCPLEDFSCFEQPVTDEDITRWRRLKAEHGHRRHEEAAYAFLEDKYPVLATTIHKHRYTAVIDEDDRPASWEEKLVYYADKRVMHDRIVPLRERLDEAHERNTLLAKTSTSRRVDMEKKVDAEIFRLEEEIFNQIDLDPEEVTHGLIDDYRARDDG